MLAVVSMGVLVIVLTWGLEWLIGFFVRDMKPTMFNAGMILPIMALWGFYANKDLAARAAVLPLLPKATKICILCFFLSSFFAFTKIRLLMFGVTSALSIGALIPIGRIVKRSEAKNVEQQ